MSERCCSLCHAAIGHHHAVAVARPKEDNPVVKDGTTAVSIFQLDKYIEYCSTPHLEAGEEDDLLCDKAGGREAEILLGKEMRGVGEEGPEEEGKELVNISNIHLLKETV